jgi:hypothetical protein
LSSALERSLHENEGLALSMQELHQEPTNEQTTNKPGNVCVCVCVCVHVLCIQVVTAS